MNYIEQVVSFHLWKEVNPLPASAIALWHELMAVCNKAGWPREFTVQSALLQATAGLSRKEFDRARQILIDKGRINYKKSHRVNSAGKYSLNTFPNVQKGQRKEQREEHDEGNGKDILYKDLKDFNSSSASSSYESFYTAHERVFGYACNPLQAQQLVAYIDQDGIEECVVIRAIERAATASARYNFKLILKILDDYFKSGVRTLEQAIALDAQFEAERTKPATYKNRKGKTSFADMAKGMAANEN